jgi:carbamoyltransferase
MLYSTFTAYLGFKVNEDEYKVMGLAAYGQPTLVEQVRKLIGRTPDGAFALDLNYFEFHTTAERCYSPRFIEVFGPPRNPYEPIDLDTAEGQRFANCAASVQRVLEDTLVEVARALHQETGLPDLCFGGGVALNGVANARILAESGFERVFVPPAPGDAGCAIGAALYCDRIHFGNRDCDLPDHPFWGPAVDGSELARLAREDSHFAEELQDGALIDQIADDLAAGRIVGWMEGALEFGPRALGHRSILAAPHTTEMRDRLNREISRLQAITHVDGTARVQVLEPAMAPRLHALLEAYGQRSGIPVLLNTSFNLAGEPIVNRAVEGYSTFLRCKVDVLVAGGTRVMKRTSAMAKTQVDKIKEEVA